MKKIVRNNLETGKGSCLFIYYTALSILADDANPKCFG